MVKYSVALAAMVLCAGPALGDTTIGGWTISPKDADGTCLGLRAYSDADDGDKRNAVVFAMGRDTDLVLAVSLSYQNWKFDKGAKITADLFVDDNKLVSQSEWDGDAQTLVATFQNAEDKIAAFAAGKTITLRTKEANAKFLTPNAGRALGALQLCLEAK